MNSSKGDRRVGAIAFFVGGALYRVWLRWCDRDGSWLLLDTEQERLAKEQAQEQLVQAARTMVVGGVWRSMKWWRWWAYG